ncbi:mannose-6-phosphate isomerase, partial [Priestia megaterium]|nr:mannose-6-phosphate isomerase [Priestia megaterium]
IVSILEGEGELVRKGQTYLLRRGDHFILPHQFGRFTIRGSLQAIASWPRTGK